MDAKFKSLIKINVTLEILNKIAEEYDNEKLKVIVETIAEDCLSENQDTHIKGYRKLVLLEDVVSIVYDSGFNDGKESIRNAFNNLMTPRKVEPVLREDGL